MATMKLEELLTKARSVPKDERMRMVARAAAEIQRRKAIGADLENGVWRDTATLQPLSQQELLRREVAYEEAKPSVDDLVNKVLVDRQWLTEALGEARVKEAVAEGHVRHLIGWL